MKALGASHIAKMGIIKKNTVEIEIEGYDITLAVKTLPIPKKATEQIEIGYGNDTIYLPGKTKVDGTMDIVLRELWDADVVRTLHAWKKIVFNDKTQTEGKPSQYKKRGSIKKYNPDGSLRMTYVLEGVFPLVVDAGEGDMDGADPVEITLSLSVDNVYPADIDTIKATNIVVPR